MIPSTLIHNPRCSSLSDEGCAGRCAIVLSLAQDRRDHDVRRLQYDRGSTGDGSVRRSPRRLGQSSVQGRGTYRILLNIRVLSAGGGGRGVVDRDSKGRLACFVAYNVVSSLCVPANSIKKICRAGNMPDIKMSTTVLVLGASVAQGQGT